MKVFGVFLFLIICSSTVFSATVRKTQKRDGVENVPLKETQVPVQIIKDPVVPTVQNQDVIIKDVKEELPQKDGVKLESENKQEDIKIEETKEKVQASEPSEEVPKPSEQVPKPSEQVPKPSEEVPKLSEEVPTPSVDVSKPFEEVPKPSEDVPKPSEDIPKPSEDSPKPSDDSPKPSEQAASKPEEPEKVTIYKQTPPANATQTGPIASISQLVQTGIQNFQQGIENIGQNIAGIIRPSQTPSQTPQQTVQQTQPQGPSILQSIQGIFRPQSDSPPSSSSPTVPAAIQQSLSNLQNTVSTGLTNITQSFQNVIRPSTTATADRPTVIEGLVQQLNTLRETILGNFQSLTGTIQSSLSAPPAQSPSVLQSVQMSVQNVSNTISSGIQNLLTPSSQASEDARPGLVQSVVGGVAQRVQNGLVRLNETVQAIISPQRVRPLANTEVGNTSASKQGLNRNISAEVVIKIREKEFLTQIARLNETIREGVQQINEGVQAALDESEDKNKPVKTEELPAESPVVAKDPKPDQVPEVKV